MSDMTHIVENSLEVSSKDSAQPSPLTSHSFSQKLEFNNPVFWLSGSFLMLFVLLAIVNTDLLSSIVSTSFTYATKWFGAFWQVLLLLNFVVGLFLAISRTGDVKLGGLNVPEIDTFKWMSIVLCTLLAGGGVFWAAAEPIAHFVSPPPFYGETNIEDMAVNALSQSFLHWGFLAWAILGGLSSIVLMHLHYDKGLPLKPRTLLYPLLGDKAINGWLGNVVDACSIIAVAAGTIGPIGFLGLQLSYALNDLFGIDNKLLSQTIVIVLAIVMYTLSALQSFIVVTAVPVSFILLPCLWQAPRIAYQMAREQGLIVNQH